MPLGWKHSCCWEERGGQLDTGQGLRKEGWGGKSGQEPLWHGLLGGMGGPGAGGGRAGLVAHTGAEPVVALPFVVHLHHAHEVEVPDLPMGTHRRQVTTCTEPAAPCRQLALARGTPRPPRPSPEPPTSAMGNALNALGTKGFSLIPFGDRGPCKLVSP